MIFKQLAFEFIDYVDFEVVRSETADNYIIFSYFLKGQLISKVVFYPEYYSEIVDHRFLDDLVRFLNYHWNRQPHKVTHSNAKTYANAFQAQYYAYGK